MKPITILFFFLFFQSAGAQDSQIIRATLHDFFYAIHTADSALMSSVLREDAILRTIHPESGELSPQISGRSLCGMIGGLSPKGQKEKIWSYDIDQDGDLAHAWMPYSFYVAGDFHHCGVNDVQLSRSHGKWKIVHVIDTRNATCKEENLSQQLHAYMDQWHEAAATADEDYYFRFMARDGIYLGTDASEKWYAHELEEWSAEYFDRDTAWAFTAVHREIYLHEDGKLAWFDEILDTWMGKCRGSGVLQQDSDGLWTLQQYNLAILVPNDLVQDYLKMKELQSSDLQDRDK